MTKNDKDSLLTLAALGQVTYESTRAVMEGLVVALLLAYHEKQLFHIPELGDISISYHGDEITPKGRRAKISVEINPDDFLVKNIGQIEDGDPGVMLQRYQKRIREHLKSLTAEEVI